nr:uncharacterized protein LOC109976608 isoform X2 [Labrus bergylta]
MTSVVHGRRDTSFPSKQQPTPSSPDSFTEIFIGDELSVCLFLWLMVIMFHPNQAALLSLLFMHGVFADQKVVHTDEEVSRGGSVIFTCNTSRENTKQINWSKGRFLFSHLMKGNETVSNFTSDRLTIDLSSKLIISNAQEDDEGLYTCHLTESSGSKTYRWNRWIPSMWHPSSCLSLHGKQELGLKPGLNLQQNPDLCRGSSPVWRRRGASESAPKLCGIQDDEHLKGLDFNILH